MSALDCQGMPDSVMEVSPGAISGAGDGVMGAVSEATAAASIVAVAEAAAIPPLVVDVGVTGGCGGGGTKGDGFVDM